MKRGGSREGGDVWGEGMDGWVGRARTRTHTQRHHQHRRIFVFMSPQQKECVIKGAPCETFPIICCQTIKVKMCMTT